MKTKRIFYTLLFLSSLCFAGVREFPLQKELGYYDWKEDYRESFVVQNKNGKSISMLDVFAAKCLPFDTACVWQYVRSWIGTALDVTHAQKASSAETGGAVITHKCRLTYSVYTKIPENVNLHCSDGSGESIHYRDLEKTLLNHFRR